MNAHKIYYKPGFFNLKNYCSYRLQIFSDLFNLHLSKPKTTYLNDACFALLGGAVASNSPQKRRVISLNPTTATMFV
jgi:hypothetical protein